MQNHFNKASAHKTNIENKQREQNYFLNNKNDFVKYANIIMEMF